MRFDFGVFITITRSVAFIHLLKNISCRKKTECKSARNKIKLPDFANNNKRQLLNTTSVNTICLMIRKKCGKESFFNILLFLLLWNTNRERRIWNCKWCTNRLNASKLRPSILIIAAQNNMWKRPNEQKVKNLLHFLIIKI